MNTPNRPGRPCAPALHQRAHAHVTEPPRATRRVPAEKSAPGRPIEDAASLMVWAATLEEQALDQPADARGIDAADNLVSVANWLRQTAMHVRNPAPPAKGGAR